MGKELLMQARGPECISLGHTPNGLSVMVHTCDPSAGEAGIRTSLGLAGQLV